MTRAESRKCNRPESPRQAVRWDSVASAYRAAGLCVRCAAQGANVRQDGSGLTSGPCSSCWPLWAHLQTVSTSRAPEAPGSAVAVTEPLGRPRARGAGPRPWELCYQEGGVRAGRYAADLATWTASAQAVAA